MNISLSVAAGFVLAAILSGCAHGPQFREFGVTTGSVANVSVQVVGDAPTIVVSQEPIYVQQDTDNAIRWSLPSGGAYYFSNTPENPGIQFDNPQMPQTDCHVYKPQPEGPPDKYTYECTYKKANKRKYHYSVRVIKDGMTRPVTSDPTVMNN